MKPLRHCTLLLLFTCIYISGYTQQPPYVIPIVFHILHTGGSTNISDAQVLDAVRILNEDYNKRNADTSVVIQSYRNNIANMQIEFRLANLDPNGQCTNGIERIYTHQTFNGGYNSSKINQWPPDKYLNVWVYDKMNGTAAYSYPPFATNFNPDFDGIVILNDYVGSIGTSNTSRSRALTHETGNYLGLLTMGWESNCVDEDSVSDTPASNEISFCSPNTISCNGVDTANYQNFMTYSYCSRMFTNGQKARVHSILNTYSTRTNLTKPANLAATGTNSAALTPCAPIADFYVSRAYACIGDTIKFIDASYNGKVTGRQWQFANANISTSADSAVAVMFNTSGWQTVTLTVLNAQGSTTITKQLVFVRPAQNFSTPYYTGFDDANEFAQNWAGLNRDNDLPKFEHITIAGRTNATSVRLDNKQSTVTGNVDELYTPSFDCSALSAADAKVNFWLSYPTANNSGTAQPLDSMVVYASKNCGASWVKIYSISGNNLINAGYIQPYYTPAENAIWNNISIAIPTGTNNYRVADVSFKVAVFGTEKSNNLYIDDFSIGSETVGVEDVSELSGVSIMPNPFTHKLMLSNIPIGEYGIMVTNLQGQVVRQQNARVDNSGTASIDLGNEAAGVYFVALRSSTAILTLQAVKQ